MYTCAPPKVDIEFDGTSPAIHSRACFGRSLFGDFHRVELVAAMPEQRFCDMCLQPNAGRGVRSNCTQEWPSRRGQRRGDVADELVRGHIVEGVHPRSRLIIEAERRKMAGCGA